MVKSRGASPLVSAPSPLGPRANLRVTTGPLGSRLELLRAGIEGRSSATSTGSSTATSPGLRQARGPATGRPLSGRHIRSTSTSGTATAGHGEARALTRLLLQSLGLGREPGSRLLALLLGLALLRRLALLRLGLRRGLGG